MTRSGSACDQVAYLDRAAASEPGRRYKEEFLAALELRLGHTVVDVGCGPGTDLTALAHAVGERGLVIGVDHDPAMVEQARHRTAADGRIEVRIGDAHALPLDDASVDRARVDRVLQHLADPARAVAELRRVVKPAGLAALAEPDWDTLVIDDTDVATSRAYTRYIATQVVRNATIGRRLGRLLGEAGFAVRSVDATAVVFRSYQAAETILRLARVAQRAWTAEAMDEPAARAWLDRLAAGPFLASFTFFTAIGQAEPAHG